MESRVRWVELQDTVGLPHHGRDVGVLGEVVARFHVGIGLHPDARETADPCRVRGYRGAQGAGRGPDPEHGVHVRPSGISGQVGPNRKRTGPRCQSVRGVEQQPSQVDRRGPPVGLPPLGLVVPAEPSVVAVVPCPVEPGRGDGVSHLDDGVRPVLREPPIENRQLGGRQAHEAGVSFLVDCCDRQDEIGVVPGPAERGVVLIDPAVIVVVVHVPTGHHEEQDASDAPVAVIHDNHPVRPVGEDAVVAGDRIVRCQRLRSRVLNLDGPLGDGAGSSIEPPRGVVHEGQLRRVVGPDQVLGGRGARSLQDGRSVLVRRQVHGVRHRSREVDERGEGPDYTAQRLGRGRRIGRGYPGCS